MSENKNKTIVAIAEKTVAAFAKEWKKNPYLWDSEADIHGELYVRIKKAIKKVDKKKIWGQYKKYMNEEARFGRVYCEPLTYVRGGWNYYPDIVIYDDCRLDNDDKRINEPMLWVCEIKYKTQWGGDQNEENREYDKEKLKELLKQYKEKIRGTKYACCLNFIRSKHKKPKFEIIKYGKRKSF